MNIMNPGMSGLWNEYPETAIPLRLLANTLLKKNTIALPPSTREYLASLSANLNDCEYCEKMHATISKQIKDDMHDIALFCLPLYKTIIEIVCKNEKGRDVPNELIQRALEYGATKQDINDVILIGASFCMYSRYVRPTDSQTQTCPIDDWHYRESAEHIAKHGY